MTTSEAPTDNGVNVQALLDADRMAVVTVALRQRTSVAVLPSVLPPRPSKRPTMSPTSAAWRSVIGGRCGFR